MGIGRYRRSRRQSARIARYDEEDADPPAEEQRHG
jgi:hypothetical protein